MKLYIQPTIIKGIKDHKVLKSYELVEVLDEMVEVYVGGPALLEPHYQKLPNLKHIILTTAGYNQLDLEYLKEKGITLTNGRGLYSIPIAESVIAHILYVNRGIDTYQKNQQKHLWAYKNDYIELTDSKVLYIGGGSIATEIQKRLQGFNVCSIVYKRSSDKGVFDEVITTKEDLKIYMKKSDYIINTLPLSNDTKNLVDQAMLEEMHKDAFYINVGRAGTHDENALLSMLKNGKIKAAYLDVFSIEPLPESSLIWDIPNLYITPHNSPSSTKNRKRIDRLITENLKRLKNGDELINKIL